MDDVLREFLTETAESLEVLDGELVKLEQGPNDPELLGNIFRLLHTIKGTCGFLGLPRLESVAHAGENILGKFRDGELPITPGAVSLTLESLDCIKGILSALEVTGSEPAGEDSDLIARLDAMADRGFGAGGEASSASGATLFEDLGGLGVIDAVVETFVQAMVADGILGEFLAGCDPDQLQGGARAHLAELLGGPSVGDPPQSIFRHLASRGVDGTNRDLVLEHFRVALHTLEVHPRVAARIAAIVSADWRDDERADVDKADAPALARTVDVEQAANAGPRDRSRVDSQLGAHSIRVSVELLENLMTMVSELVLTRNQLLQILRLRKETDFTAPLHRLNQITSELQEGVMRTRMQPIANAWAKLPRLVRDLSCELGKKIELEMVGGETELDRQILEVVKDPLTHMVRNSADHGLESLEERKTAGKPEVGTIRLAAHHEGGHIVIAVSDDGRGLSLDRIKAKAAANGLHSRAELSKMSDQQVMQLIFNAGLSTAEKITSVSGRGVGMDVVKTNIERIGGSIDIKSAFGKGATFTVKIPLTLAIISALIVETRGERFAIPQIGVCELVRASAKSEHKIEFINNAPVLRLRNRLLPLVSLASVLKLEGEAAPAGEIAEDAFIVVAQIGIASLGIIVDKVFDTEEIVVKPVAPILRDIQVFSGNTILGDGCIVMILDLNGVANAASDLVAADEDIREVECRGRARDDRTAFLVFKAGGNSPKVVLLSLVARLEEIEAETIEYSSGGPLVQYRGQLMPLIPVETGQSLKTEGRQSVIVFTEKQRSMGLMVDEIVDIVDDRLNVELAAAQPGLLGSAVIDGRASEVIDAGYYFAKAHPDWLTSTGHGDAARDARRRVLLIDDSPFFRNVLTPLLSVAGYDVTPVENADRAFNLHDAGEDFDIIVSDVELPGMSGYELAETIKKSTRWRDIPLVALSSRNSPAELRQSRAVGFSDVVSKVDREALLRKISETLGEVRGAA
jgi:two-component system, chemotaxis family, sensor kinase CheA